MTDATKGISMTKEEVEEFIEIKLEHKGLIKLSHAMEDELDKLIEKLYSGREFAFDHEEIVDITKEINEKSLSLTHTRRTIQDNTIRLIEIRTKNPSLKLLEMNQRC